MKTAYEDIPGQGEKPTCGQSFMHCTGLTGFPVTTVMDAAWYGKQNTTHTFVKTPTDYGMDFDDVTFPAEDGVKISAWLIPPDPTKEWPVKKLAIVGHQSWSEANRSGCCNHKKNLYYKIEAIDYVKLHKVLHDDGFYVLAYDLRNHGQSEHKMPSGYGEVEYKDAVGVMDYVNQHPVLKECKVCLLPFCVSGHSFMKANHLYPDKFENVVAWAVTNIFQFKHFLSALGVWLPHVDQLFEKKQASYVAKGLLKAGDPNIQFSVARLNATLWAKDVKAPVLYCDPKNDSIDDHKKDAPEIFAEFQKNGKANEFHFIGSTEEGPFKTKGDNRSEGYNFYQSEAGSKVLLEFFAKHCN